jgi:hypothetical protein
MPKPIISKNKLKPVLARTNPLLISQSTRAKWMTAGLDPALVGSAAKALAELLKNLGMQLDALPKGSTFELLSDFGLIPKAKPVPGSAPGRPPDLRTRLSPPGPRGALKGAAGYHGRDPEIVPGSERHWDRMNTRLQQWATGVITTDGRLVVAGTVSAGEGFSGFFTREHVMEDHTPSQQTDYIEKVVITRADGSRAVIVEKRTDGETSRTAEGEPDIIAKYEELRQADEDDARAEAEPRGADTGGVSPRTQDPDNTGGEGMWRHYNPFTRMYLGPRPVNPVHVRPGPETQETIGPRVQIDPRDLASQPGEQVRPLGATPRNIRREAERINPGPRPPKA